jgi:hypothetical protein
MELSRAVASGAALAELLASDPAPPLRPIVERWCERERRVAAAVASRHAVDHGAWSRRLVDHVHAQGDDLRALADFGPTAVVPPRPSRGVFFARWPGPFNYRGMLAQLSPSDRDAVIALFLADKRNYAVLTHLAMVADSSATRDDAIDTASLALRYPIAPATVERLWSALLASKWIECPTS